MESSNVQLNAQVATDLEDDFGLIDYASPSLEPTEVADSFEPLPNTAASKLNRGTADDGLIDFEDAESDVVVSEYGGDNGGNGNDEAAGGFGDNSELVDTDTSMADVDIPAPDIVEAESAEPVVTECIESAMTEPVVTEPVEPVMAEFSEPVVIEPVEPVVTESVEPIVAEPVVTEPVVTEPVVTEPAVTEPVKSTDTEAAEVDVTVTDITDVADVADVDVEMIGAELPTSDALAVSASSDPATATIADATVGSSEQTDAEPMDSENDSGVPEMWLRVESEWVPFLGPMQHAYSADDQRCLFGISIADLIDMLQTDCGLTGKDLALEFPSLNVVLDKRDRESKEQTLEGLYSCHMAAVQMGMLPVDYVNSSYFSQLSESHFILEPSPELFLFVLHTRPQVQQALNRIMDIKQQAEEATEQNGSVEQSRSAEEQNVAEEQTVAEDAQPTTAALLDEVQDQDDEDDDDFEAEEEDESDHVLDADAEYGEDEVDDEDNEEDIKDTNGSDAEAGQDTEEPNGDDEELEVEEIQGSVADGEEADQEMVEIVEDEEGAKTRVDSVATSPSNKRTKTQSADDAVLVDDDEEPAAKKAKGDDVEQSASATAAAVAE